MVDRLRPMASAIRRSLSPQACLSRRTSRIFRIGALSAGIGPPLHHRKGAACRDSFADSESRRPALKGVADFDQNGWPDCARIGGRFRPDYAVNPSEALWPYRLNVAAPPVGHVRLPLEVAAEICERLPKVFSTSIDIMTRSTLMRPAHVQSPIGSRSAGALAPVWSSVQSQNEWVLQHCRPIPEQSCCCETGSSLGTRRRPSSQSKTGRRPRRGYAERCALGREMNQRRILL